MLAQSVPERGMMGQCCQEHGREFAVGAVHWGLRPGLPSRVHPGVVLSVSSCLEHLCCKHLSS